MTSVYIYNTAGEKFSFAEGMVETVSSQITNELQDNILPSAGPMSNQYLDYNGVAKTITIRGVLFDTISSVTDSEVIKDKKVMKKWLEALMNGTQVPVLFVSPNEEKTMQDSLSTTPFDDSVTVASVNIQGTWVPTKVMIMSMTFDEEAGNPEQIPFTINTAVSGYV